MKQESELQTAEDIVSGVLLGFVLWAVFFCIMIVS